MNVCVCVDWSEVEWSGVESPASLGFVVDVGKGESVVAYYFTLRLGDDLFLDEWILQTRQRGSRIISLHGAYGVQCHVHYLRRA